jgi:hypothetical protein
VRKNDKMVKAMQGNNEDKRTDTAKKMTMIEKRRRSGVKLTGLNVF